jgi:hypothetical protein
MEFAREYVPGICTYSESWNLESAECSTYLDLRTALRLPSGADSMGEKHYRLKSAREGAFCTSFLLTGTRICHEYIPKTTRLATLSLFKGVCWLSERKGEVGDVSAPSIISLACAHERNDAGGAARP